MASVDRTGDEQYSNSIADWYDDDFSQEPCEVCDSLPCRCVTVTDEHGEVLHGFRF